MDIEVRRRDFTDVIRIGSMVAVLVLDSGGGTPGPLTLSIDENHEESLNHGEGSREEIWLSTCLCSQGTGET
jgi:hypothetical protein